MTDHAPTPDIDTPVDRIVDEADPAPASFTYGGQTFTFADKVDVRVVAALQRGNFNRALVLALGEEQTAALMDVDGDEPFDADKLRELIEAWSQRSGTTLGESKASTGS
jgi:hypothetical protein